VQRHVLPSYNTSNHKRGRFAQTLRNHNLVYTPIACTKTTNHNLVWRNFEQFYALITSSQELHAYAFHTYPDLEYFLESWDKHKKFKYVPLIGLECTPLTRWKLGPGQSKSWC
jgi:hypothetical protein